MKNKKVCINKTSEVNSKELTTIAQQASNNLEFRNSDIQVIQVDTSCKANNKIIKEEKMIKEILMEEISVELLAALVGFYIVKLQDYEPPCHIKAELYLKDKYNLDIKQDSLRAKICFIKAIKGINKKPKTPHRKLRRVISIFDGYSKAELEVILNKVKYYSDWEFGKYVAKLEGQKNEQ